MGCSRGINDKQENDGWIRSDSGGEANEKRDCCLLSVLCTRTYRRLLSCGVVLSRPEAVEDPSGSRKEERRVQKAEVDAGKDQVNRGKSTGPDVSSSSQKGGRLAVVT